MPFYLCRHLYVDRRHPDDGPGPRPTQAEDDFDYPFRHGHLRHRVRHFKQDLLSRPLTYFLCLHELVLPRSHRGDPGYELATRLVAPPRRLPRSEELDWRIEKGYRSVQVATVDQQQEFSTLWTSEPAPLWRL